MPGPDSPRFQSDGEQEPSEKVKAARAKGLEILEAAGKWDAKGVDIDQRTLEGRKANRGFTMSVGSSTKPEDSVAAGIERNAKRAQTLPASSTRRGDHTLSEESQEKLAAAQGALAARIRRGSVTVAVTLVTEEMLKAEWAEMATHHVYGIMTEGQGHSDEREHSWSNKDGSKALPGPEGLQSQKIVPVISCQKGCKGLRDTTPNQDNFSITYFTNGWNLVCAFDGHGPFGHLVSTRTVQTVPFYFSKHLTDNVDPSLTGAARDAEIEKHMEGALIAGFERAQKDIVMLAVTDVWDVQASGSTAVAAAWKGNVVYSANAGDSRVVIGTEAHKKVVFETQDHKPNTPAEMDRINASGGEVRSQTYPDGWVNHRIFVKGEDFPGLCMARTLGDCSVKDYGVIATPEVCRATVNLAEDPFFIISSDGVWEFLDSEFVVKAMAKKIKSDGPERTLQKLQREAKKRWRQEEGDYCDDITSVLVQLR